MPAFPTPEPLTAQFDVAAGSITVIASNRVDTVVTVEPSDPGKPGDVKAAAATRVDLHGGTLSVQAARSWRHFAPFGGESVDVTVELPTGSSVRGSALGSLFTEGRLSGCTFVSRAGNVRLDEVERLDVRAAAGSVVVGRAVGSTTIVASAGGVRIRDVDGEATIKNTNGYTEVGHVVGSLRVNGAHGLIAIGSLAGDLTVRCAYGDIRVERALSGQARLETSYGAIEVGVPDGTAAWVDARTQNGTVRNLLQDVPGPEQNDRVVELRAGSRFGDIVVRRADA